MEGEKSENIKNRNDQLLHEHMFEAYEENVCCYTNACSEDKKKGNQVLHECMIWTQSDPIFRYKFQGAVGQIMHLILSQKLNLILQW